MEETWDVEFIPEGDDKVVPVIKADEFEQIVYGIVLEPGVPDSYGDIETEKAIEDAANNYLLKARSVRFEINADHDYDIEAHVVQSFTAKTDFWFDGTPRTDEYKVRKGSWVLGVKIFDKEIFDRVLSGEFTGFSMEGWGRRVAV